MYQRKVNADILNAVKSLLADVWSVSPSVVRAKRDTFSIVLCFTLFLYSLPLVRHGLVSTFLVLTFHKSFSNFYSAPV